ncbi:MAG: arylsulfatase [Verrucomicrobiales bacterium]|nr:arylsulfatase [Verrucomicrobiales bacterium]
MKIAFLSLCFALVSLSGLHAEPLKGSQPNIVVVMTDDQGYAPVGRHGHPWLKTPNMDTLFDTSTRFDRFLVSPTCSPTRAALMSGRHPMKNGITHTILERERMALESTTLPEVLKTAGYTTGIFGKWHLGDEEAYQPHERGFDEVFIHGAGGIGQAYDCSCADAPDNSYFNPVIRHNGSFVQTEGYCTDLFFEAGLGWIKSVKDQEAPFFTYISTNAPHSPFVAPPENAKRFTDLGFEEKVAGFYGMIENIDTNIGLMLGKLEEWDLMKDTVVIFMSDNGMTGGGSGAVGKLLGTDTTGSPMYLYNAGMRGQKGSADEGGVRVPFFVRWDGKIDPDKEIKTIGAHIDILPTLADLAGAKIPEDQVEGRSLLPLIENPDAEWADRYLFTHKARWATGSEPNDHQWANWAVRNQRFRLVGAGTAKNIIEKKNKKAVQTEDRLYDMEADPGQKTNVIDQFPEVAKEMREAYEAFWKETRPLMVNEEAPMSPTRPFHVLFEEQTAAGGIPKWEAPEL